MSNLADYLQKWHLQLSMGKTVAAAYLNNWEARRELDVSPHVNKTDTAINSTLQIVTGCLKPTPASYLPVLAGITPAKLRWDVATLTLARKAQKNDGHFLHKATITSAPPGRLKSRHPYNKVVQKMLQSIPEDLSRDA
ncbi:hypothetical protein SRHO_G00033990 [Serrasalmus rhombeus]